MSGIEIRKVRTKKDLFAYAKGYRRCGLSWQLEGVQAIPHFAAGIGATPYRKYRICEQQIIPQGA